MPCLVAVSMWNTLFSKLRSRIAMYCTVSSKDHFRHVLVSLCREYNSRLRRDPDVPPPRPRVVLR